MSKLWQTAFQKKKNRGVGDFVKATKDTPYEDIPSRKSKKTRPEVKVLDESRADSKPVVAVDPATEGTALDKENEAPEDDGFEVPAYQRRKQKTQNRKDDIQDAQADIEKSKEKDLNENWRDRFAKTQKAEDTLAKHQAENARKQERRRQEDAVMRRPASKTIGRHANTATNNGAIQKTLKFNISFSEQVPGAIFYHEEVRPLRGHPTLKIGDPHTFQNHRGVWCYTHGRFFIVYTRHTRKVNECEVLTFGNTGAKNIAKEELCEFVNLKPKGAKDYQPQIPGAAILEVGTKLGYRSMNRITMVVRISCPHSRDLDCDELERAGALTDASLQLLIAEIQKLEGRNAQNEQAET